MLPISSYCSIPSLAEVDSSFEYTPGLVPYANPEIFDRAVLTETLDQLSRYAAEFDPPTEGDPDHCSGFFWNNGQFTHSDALAYYCFVRLLRPRTILEVGSGFSTLVARDAIVRNGVGRLVCVEPNPRRFLEDQAQVELVRKPVRISIPVFFATSSKMAISWSSINAHSEDRKRLRTCTCASVPHLGRDVVVHAHDIFLPSVCRSNGCATSRLTGRSSTC